MANSALSGTEKQEQRIWHLMTGSFEGRGNRGAREGFARDVEEGCVPAGMGADKLPFWRRVLKRLEVLGCTVPRQTRARLGRPPLECEVLWPAAEEDSGNKLGLT
eukprot:3896382-Rhodomonas_salina.1